MRAAGVASAALIPPRWEGRGDAVVLEAAERYPESFVPIGRLDLFSAGAGDRICHRQAGIRALRVMFPSSHDRVRALDAAAEKLWTAVEARDTPVMIYPPQGLGVVEHLAQTHPRLRIAVDHMALPVGLPITDAGQHLRELSQLARYPSVSVKATALPAAATDVFPFASTHDALRQVVDAFGPERVFWGSDLSRLQCPYEQVVDFAVDALAGHGTAATELVMGAALAAWLAPDQASEKPTGVSLG